MRLLSSLALLLTLAFTPAYAGLIHYSVHLTGPAESPPNASAGVGDAEIDFDLAAHLLSIDVSFSGLTGTTTASHIHCCTSTPGTGTAGVATQTPTFIGFPLGVTSGTYLQPFDTSLASTWNATFINNQGGVSFAEAALAAGLANGEAYLNIHTTTFPGGEIRGFIVPAASVPEPSSGVLAFMALLVLCFARLPAIAARGRSEPV